MLNHLASSCTVFTVTSILQEVHLWTARLDEQGAENLRVAESLLDKTELARAGRFYFERDQRRFTITRGILRALLARYLNMSPSAVTFGYTGRGKPFLAIATTTTPPADLRFNVSHSGGEALFAFAHDREIGVDVEAGERLGDDWPAIARRYFSLREQAELLALPTHQQRAAFLTGWARKEAYLKATGLGIADGLQKIEVTLDPARSAGFLSPELAARWTFCDPGASIGGSSASALVVARRNPAEAPPAVQRFSVTSLAALLVHQHG